MSDPALALQNTIEAALRGDAGLLASMGLQKVRLYTMSAPVGASHPYIVIGEDQVIDDSTECAESSEVITTVHAWTRVDDDVSASRRQAKAMAGDVRRVLKSIDAVPGFDVVLAEFEDTRHLTDSDGLTAHSVITHRFLLDPA
nr:DUF3168 domain-containing protein [uncultured Brevundimonas sp.]